jgi:hypothetical protein
MIEHESEFLKGGHFWLFDVAFLRSVKHGFVMMLGIDTK